MKDVRIVVATHKRYRMPEEKMYLPLHVGREGKESIGYAGDNTGDHISLKNDYLNELTGLYWAWKNLECSYIGLVHYRRYFTTSHFVKRFIARDKYGLIANQDEIEKHLSNTDIILPAKRRYYIETIESHFRHLPYTKEEDLEVLREIITTEYPEYRESFEKVMKRRWAHMFNMFIMKRNYLEEYCEWAFPILLELDQKIHHEGRTVIQNRAYVSEFLIDTWVETKGYSYMELPVMFAEKEHLLRKVYLLIKRKVIRNSD